MLDQYFYFQNRSFFALLSVIPSSLHRINWTERICFGGEEVEASDHQEIKFENEDLNFIVKRIFLISERKENQKNETKDFSFT